MFPTALVFSLCVECGLRQHQSSVRDNVQQGQANTEKIPLNLERYKKTTVVSIALVQLALVICYFPPIIFLIFIYLKGIHPSIHFLFDLASAILFLNSSLNPFLYCWRIKEIRQAVKATIRRFCACLSQGTSTLSTNQ